MKQNHRYIDLAYDDDSIINPLRLRIPVHLDITFKHWPLLSMGTKFFLNKSRVWNQTKQTNGPVKLSLTNAKVYFLEIPNDFSHRDDIVNKWLQLTDVSDSDDSETDMSSKNETAEEN